MQVGLRDYKEDWRCNLLDNFSHEDQNFHKFSSNFPLPGDRAIKCLTVPSLCQAHTTNFYHIDCSRLQVIASEASVSL